MNHFSDSEKRTAERNAKLDALGRDSSPSQASGKTLALPKSGEALTGASVAPALRYKLLTGADVCNMPPMRYRLHDVFPEVGLGVIWGASSVGKSFLAEDFGFAIADPDVDEWFGLKVTHCPVTIVSLEGEAGLSKRTKALSLHHKKPIPDALRFVLQPLNLFSDDVEELARAIIAGGGANGVVIIDTLNRAAPGANENAPEVMSNIIAAAKELQILVGGLVILIHHAGKDITKGMRGHSSLYAALDGSIEVRRDGNSRSWIIDKVRDDEDGATFPFKLEIVPVGVDDEGDEITSCVITADELIDNTMHRALPPKAGNQKIIWDALGAVLRASSHYGQAGAPAGRPCIRLDEAIEKTHDRLLCVPKRQSERTQSAIRGLVTRGLLEHRDGWLWVV